MNIIQLGSYGVAIESPRNKEADSSVEGEREKERER
jgi:hypothetical protein